MIYNWTYSFLGGISKTCSVYKCLYKYIISTVRGVSVNKLPLSTKMILWHVSQIVSDNLVQFQAGEWVKAENWHLLSGQLRKAVQIGVVKP